MLKNKKSEQFNLVTGKGFSVNEVVTSVRRVTGHPIPVKYESRFFRDHLTIFILIRRDGDPAILIASSEKAENVLGWKRKYITMDSIVKTAVFKSTKSSFCNY